MFDSRLRQCLAAAFLFMAFSTTCHADVISYSISGFINTANDPLNDFGISVNDPFIGTAVYDTSMPVLSNSPGNFVYRQPPPIAPLTVEIIVAGLTFTADNNSSLTLQVTNNAAGLKDRFVLNSQSVIHANSANYMASGMGMSLIDNSETVFSGTAIPSTLNLNDFDNSTVFMSFHDPDSGNTADFNGTITSLTRSIPEPAGAWFVGLSVLVLSHSRRRRSL